MHLGVSHTRGNPPNVVETDPRTWLLLATGLLALRDAVADGSLRLSGSRAAELAELATCRRVGEMKAPGPALEEQSTSSFDSTIGRANP